MFSQCRRLHPPSVLPGRSGRSWLAALLLAALLGGGIGLAAAEEAADLRRTSTGQTLYVPIYSSISFVETMTLHFAVTVSIRNTDLDAPVRILSIRYFDNDGVETDGLLDSARSLDPMASMELFIRQSERIGHVGANLVVDWRSDVPVTPPLVEAVMIGVSGARGYAFTSRAVVIGEAQ